MKKMLLTLALLTTLTAFAGGNLHQQHKKVFMHRNKTGVFTSFPDKMPEATRLAFPYAKTALLIDLYAPVKPDMIKIPLIKMSLQSKERSSEAPAMQVYAGNSPQQLQLVKDIKVTVNAVDRKGVPGEDITVSNLPEARYFQIYIPRTRNSYVFGLLNAGKDIQVLAATPALDLDAVRYKPQVTIGNDLLKRAITPKACGYNDAPAGKTAVDAGFAPKFGNGACAWPWRTRFMEAELPEAQNIEAIVLDLQVLNLTVRMEEPVAQLKAVRIFTSMDGKNFTEAACSAPEIEHYRKGKDFCTRLIWRGNFRGKYFRLQSGIYRHRFYVTGTRRLNESLKFVPASKITLNKFELPFSTGGKFQAVLNVEKPASVDGTALFYLQPGNRLLARYALASGSDQIVDLALPEGVQGFCSIELVLQQTGLKDVLKFSRKLQVIPGRICLNPASGTDKFQLKKYFSGNTALDLYSAAVAGAELKYIVPADGNFSIQAVIRGKGRFQVTAPGLNNVIALAMWHPQDLREVTAGENFCGAVRLRTNDVIIFKALDKDAAIGDVKLLPLSDDLAAAAAAAPEIKPAVILHSDGYSGFFSRDESAETLRNIVKNYPQCHVHTFDWCVGTTAVNYPSKVSTVFGQQKNVNFYRNGDRLAAERLKKLHAAGVIPPAVLREATGKLNLRYSITLRANPYYSYNSMNAQFFIDNPQFFQRTTDNKRFNQPSYAYPEVRNFYLGLIKEIAAFKPDAVCIEFLRHPTFFMYDKPIIDEYTRRYGKCTPADYLSDNWNRITCDIMFEYLQEVRRAIDAVDPAIALEINFHYRDYIKHGIDIERILKAGLVDMISPGNPDTGTEKFFDLTEFVNMAKKSPRKVLVFPRVEGTIYGGDPTPEEEKGLIKIQRRSMSSNMFKAVFIKFLAQGADGLRPFNTGGGWLARDLADRSELKRFELFVMPLLDIRSELK